MITSRTKYNQHMTSHRVAYCKRHVPPSPADGDGSEYISLMVHINKRVKPSRNRSLDILYYVFSSCDHKKIEAGI